MTGIFTALESASKYENTALRSEPQLPKNCGMDMTQAAPSASALRAFSIAISAAKCVTVTITGTRHRSGVWNGESAESSHPVAFTVFVACEPSFDRCQVLRLSQVDNPLR